MAQSEEIVAVALKAKAIVCDRCLQKSAKAHLL